MTTLEQLCQSLNCSAHDLEECLDFQCKNGHLTDEIRLVMIKFARKMIKDCINSLPENLSEVNLNHITEFRKEII